MAGLLLETLHFAKGIDPVADAFAGADVRSDVYAMRDYESVVFIVYVGVGATGTSTIIVNSCDDVTPTTRTAMPFYSRDVLTTDVQSAITKRAAAGYIRKPQRSCRRREFADTTIITIGISYIV